MKVELTEENMEDLKEHLNTLRILADTFGEKEIRIADLSLYGLKFLENTPLRKLEKQAFIAVRTRMHDLHDKKVRDAFWTMRGKLMQLKGCEYDCDCCENHCQSYKDLCNATRLPMGG